MSFYQDSYSVVFVIAQKYVKGYPCFIDYYVKNIQTFYPDNSLILIVDNNSTYIHEIQTLLKNTPNLMIITNNSESKFELGAYKFGAKYIIENNIQSDYFVFTQDTYVIKNKFPFETLIEKNVLATPIVSFENSEFYKPLVQRVLKKLNTPEDFHTLCWANSFVLHYSVLPEFLSITQDIVTKTKEDACDCERFLGAILYKLNSNKNYYLDGNGVSEIRPYDCWTVDLVNTPTSFYFMKKVTNKQEDVEDYLGPGILSWHKPCGF